MTSNDYTPVSCATHSEYELAIMHKQKLCITRQDASGTYAREIVEPKDIITREHAEYLLVEYEQGDQKEIRLDKIIKAYTVNNQ